MRKIRINLALVMLLLLLPAGPAVGQQSSQRETKTPPATLKLATEKATRIRKAGEQIEQRQREIEMLQLQARNILLEAALELGLNKAQFEGMELAADAEGNLVFKPKAAPPDSPPK